MSLETTDSLPYPETTVQRGQHPHNLSDWSDHGRSKRDSRSCRQHFQFALHLARFRVQSRRQRVDLFPVGLGLG
jgi:hypothetical protein